MFGHSCTLSTLSIITSFHALNLNHERYSIHHLQWCILAIWYSTFYCQHIILFYWTYSLKVISSLDSSELFYLNLTIDQWF